MGIAILSGILSSLYDIQSPKSSIQLQAASGTSTPAEEVPMRLPSRFIACVRRPESAKRVKQTLVNNLNVVKIVQNDNVQSCKAADIILLGCKPYMVKDILAEPGMKEALKGKLLISICAGVPVTQIEEAIYGEATKGDQKLRANAEWYELCPTPHPGYGRA